MHALNKVGTVFGLETMHYIVVVVLGQPDCQILVNYAFHVGRNNGNLESLGTKLNAGIGFAATLDDALVRHQLNVIVIKSFHESRLLFGKNVIR